MMREVDSKVDDRGELVALYSNEFDFDWKRCFILKNCKEGSVRGNHGHRRENQIMLVLKGSIEIESDNGKTKEVTVLKENQYILLPHLTWNTFEFLEEGTSVLVLGSEDFDEDEYIRDYEEFRSLV